MFKNRVEELKLFEDLYSSNKSKLIVLYGRRRVGKSELLKEFSKKKKSLYLLARQESEKDQLVKMSRDIAFFFKDVVLEKNPFQNYDALFTYLSKNLKGIPVFFDEFPFLVQSNKALPSILQDYWDNYFSKTHSFFVLCGSSITMMESLLGYKSPLYGRRTEQILLEPLKFRDACLFFKDLSKEDKIVFYSILGGTPAYLLEFDYKKSLINNLSEKVFKKNCFLYQDVLFVLREEFNEPRNYFSILKSLAKGNTKIGSIINDTGLDKGIITKYLSVLESLHLIERKVPITEKNPQKSRKGIYLLKDNYFKFWFRFLFENIEYIEQEKQDKLIKEKISPELNEFVGRAFENIALEWILRKEKDYLFGKWWDKEEEVDLLGVNREKNKILLGEVKWKILGEQETKKIIEDLKRKSKLIKLGNPDLRKEKYVIIAKKFKKKIKGAILFDLEDLIECV